MSKDTVHSKTSIQWNSLWFHRTARHCCLLLAHPAYGNKCSTSEKPEVDFESWSSRSPAKSESWNKPNRQCWVVFTTWQYRRSSLVWWILHIKLAKRLPQARVHFVTALASFFTYHRIPYLQSRTEHKYFKTIWEHTNSPTISNSSILKLCSSRQGVVTKYKCSIFQFACWVQKWEEANFHSHKLLRFYVSFTLRLHTLQDDFATAGGTWCGAGFTYTSLQLWNSEHNLHLYITTIREFQNTFHFSTILQFYNFWTFYNSGILNF